MSAAGSRQWTLLARPQGDLRDGDVRLDEVQVPDPGPGEVRVRNTWLSVDPWTRSQMDEAPTYVPSFPLGSPVEAEAVGVVEAVGAGVEGVHEGDEVLHGKGWREVSLVDAADARVLDTSVVPAQTWLGVLGTTGLTAYVGLLDVAGFREGDVVLVSGAAGAVGSVAGQVARLRGASAVVGLAGTPEKVRWLLDDAGFTAAADHHDAPPEQLLADLLPGGADVYFDNVAGPTLEAAIPRMRTHGRIALCGAISGYGSTDEPAGPSTFHLARGKRLTMRGFLVGDHLDRRDAFVADMTRWIAAGELAHRETVVDGVEATDDALRGLLSGANTGKMLVRLPPGA